MDHPEDSDNHLEKTFKKMAKTIQDQAELDDICSELGKLYEREETWDDDEIKHVKELEDRMNELVEDKAPKANKNP